MRKALAPEHRSHFIRLGSIIFEDVLGEKDLKKLNSLQPFSPNSAPLISFLRHKQLAEIAFELTGKEPLRIAKIFLGNQVDLQEDQYALCIALDQGALIYSQLPSLLLQTEEALVIILTSRYLDPDRHPVVFRRD